ncbi:hypothetical protein D9757_007449 [Collybiopsis confluens]|uniref:Uncharacterized protein n=1 Tax=Collybiopsis confluens TaxID=2823264 RepID=A0A8H5HJZ2_9AGAR|nr:hypothetical protein D9757_007449 [Collybiopsis confluens]
MSEVRFLKDSSLFDLGHTAVSEKRGTLVQKFLEELIQHTELVKDTELGKEIDYLLRSIPGASSKQDVLEVPAEPILASGKQMEIEVEDSPLPPSLDDSRLRHKEMNISSMVEKDSTSSKLESEHKMFDYPFTDNPPAYYERHAPKSLPFEVKDSEFKRPAKRKELDLNIQDDFREDDHDIMVQTGGPRDIVKKLWLEFDDKGGKGGRATCDLFVTHFVYQKGDEIRHHGAGEYEQGELFFELDLDSPDGGCFTKVELSVELNDARDKALKLMHWEPRLNFDSKRPVKRTVNKNWNISGGLSANMASPANMTGAIGGATTLEYMEFAAAVNDKSRGNSARWTVTPSKGEKTMKRLFFSLFVRHLHNPLPLIAYISLECVYIPPRNPFLRTITRRKSAEQTQRAPGPKDLSRAGVKDGRYRISSGIYQ